MQPVHVRHIIPCRSHTCEPRQDHDIKVQPLHRAVGHYPHCRNIEIQIVVLLGQVILYIELLSNMLRELTLQVLDGMGIGYASYLLTGIAHYDLHYLFRLLLIVCAVSDYRKFTVAHFVR